MGNIELSLAINSNPRSNPILSGQISPQGVDLRCSRLHASELFWRQLGYQEFQISEMSMSSLLISIANGIDTWVAIPVFTTRRFFHTGVLVREGGWNRNSRRSRWLSYRCSRIPADCGSVDPRNLAA